MLNIVRQQKIYKNYSLVLFMLILFISFVFINIGSGLFFSRWKADLTNDSRYTLSQASRNIISEIKSPLYIRVYLSSAISNDYPALYQYSQTLLRQLESYKNLNPDNIAIEIKNPEPYSPTAEEAKKLGLKSFLSADKQNELYFGAVLGNDNGDTRIIEQFLPARAGYFESDISRAINALNNPLKSKIGIISENLQTAKQAYGQGKQQKPGFLRLLLNEYDVVQLPSLTAEIPYDIEALIVVAPQKMSNLLAYAIDQYLLRGGRVLFLADPYSETNKHAQGDEESLKTLFQNWKIQINQSNVIGNTGQGKTFINESSHGEIAYTNPLRIDLNKTNINSELPFTKNLDNIILRSAGNLKIEKAENIKATPIFKIQKNNGTINSEELKLLDDTMIASRIKPTKQEFTAAVMLEGTTDSSFMENPLKNTAFEQEMLPFILTSIKAGKLVIIADSDFLNDNAWINSQISGTGNTYDIVPYNQNGEFLLRVMDYLTDAKDTVYLGSKRLTPPQMSVSQKIYNKNFQPYKAQYNQTKNQLSKQEEIYLAWLEIIQSNSSAINMSSLKKIEQTRQNINNLQQELKKIEYQVRQETDRKTKTLIWTNIIAIPLILLVGIWIINIIRTKKTQNKVREIINEYKIS